MDHIDEPPGTPDRAVSAGALSRLEDVERTNDADAENSEAAVSLVDRGGAYSKKFCLNPGYVPTRKLFGLDLHLPIEALLRRTK